MAHLSGDENMINVFREGKDLHAATAATIYKKAIDEVSRDERSKSKRANFGIIYGITIFGLAERLEISRDEARQLIDGFFETFPQVHDYMEQAKEQAREKGYAETVIRIYNRFKNEGIRSKMILQVHDELNFSVYPEEKERVEKIVLEEMQNAFQMKVPLVADSGWGTNWLEAH